MISPAEGDHTATLDLKGGSMGAQATTSPGTGSRAAVPQVEVPRGDMTPSGLAAGRMPSPSEDGFPGPRGGA